MSESNSPVFFNIDLFLAPGVDFPLYPEFSIHYYTMILQCIRIIVGDAGFEPGTKSHQGFQEKFSE